MASEINEKEEEDGEQGLFPINAEARRDKIRRIIQHQRSLYFSSSSSSSSSFSSAAAATSSLSSSRRSAPLLELMKEGSTSLRRLFDMEHTSLATHFNDYSGSPLIRPILLWGSDGEEEVHPDPWLSISPNGAVVDSRSDHKRAPAVENSLVGEESSKGSRKERRERPKLVRTKSFRRLPRYSLWRCRGFRFRFRLRRTLRIMICGRKV